MSCRAPEAVPGCRPGLVNASREAVHSQEFLWDHSGTFTENGLNEVRLTAWRSKRRLLFWVRTEKMGPQEPREGQMGGA